MIITTNAQKLEDKGRVASLPLNDNDLLFVWQNGQQKVVNANEVGGKLERTTITITTPTLPVGEFELGSIDSPLTGIILKVECSHPLNIRLYPNESTRDADYLRPFRTTEPEGCGIQYEFEAVTTPVVLLESYGQPEKVFQTDSGLLYYSVRNKSNDARTLSVTFTILNLE